MKKAIKSILCVTTMMFVTMLPTTSVRAATSQEDGVIMDNNEMNGGVDLTPVTLTKEQKDKIASSDKKTKAGPAGKYLNVVHQTQENVYYCGPASDQ